MMIEGNEIKNKGEYIVKADNRLNMLKERKKYLRRVILISYLTREKEAMKYYKKVYNKIKSKEDNIKLSLDFINKI